MQGAQSSPGVLVPGFVLSSKILIGPEALHPVSPAMSILTGKASDAIQHGFRIAKAKAAIAGSNGPHRTQKPSVKYRVW